MALVKSHASAFFQNLLRLIDSIVEKHLSAVVQNLSIENRFVVFPTIGEGGVSRSQIQICNALGNAAQCEGLVVVSTDQCGDTEILCIFIAEAGSDLC